MGHIVEASDDLLVINLAQKNHDGDIDSYQIKQSFSQVKVKSLKTGRVSKGLKLPSPGNKYRHTLSTENILR